MAYTLSSSHCHLNFLLGKKAVLMVITDINPVLSVCSLISLSKSARIFIPDRAMPRVYNFVFILLLGLQGPTRGNTEEDTAKLRGDWQHVTPSMGVRVIVVKTLLNFSCSGISLPPYSGAKRWHDEIQMYNTSSI